MTIISFSHIGLTCNDPLLVEEFYVKHFEFIRTRVYAPGPDQVVMIKSGNIYLELFKATKESPVSDAEGAGPDYKGWKHICFMVDNLDDKLKEIGADLNISLGPLDMSAFIEGMRVCWIVDPEGNIIELNQGYIDEENSPKL